MELPENEKVILIEKFSKLNTIDEKFDFWLDNFKRPFHRWWNITYSEIKPFMILSEKPDEIEYINKKCIEQFVEYDQFISRKKKVLNIDDLRNNFNLECEKVKNKKNLVEVERTMIENKKKEYELTSNILPNSELFFKKAFKDSYLNDISPDLTKKVFEINDLIAINNGYVLAQYSRFLDETLTPSKIVKHEELTHAQQMLILDYLGIAKDLNNKKRAEVYSAIIRRPVDNTRQLFSKLGQEKNKKNLNIVLKFFNDFEFKSEAEKVEKDLIRKNK